MARSMFITYLLTFWRPLVLVLAPALFSLVFLHAEEDDEAAVKCAYVLLVMATFWMTEVLPVAITALIPVAAFPLMGVMSTKDVAVNYMKAINFLFMGGLMMAIAVENSGLHKRISLSLLKLIGTSPNYVMFSFMVTTAFLSMWISNTASTAMMIPIVEAVVRTIDRAEQKGKEELEMTPEVGKGGDGDRAGEEKHNLSSGGVARRRMLMLSVAYAANVGGTGVMTGSPPNLVLPQKLEDQFGPGHPLSFPTWMIFSIPLMVLNLVLAFLWLSAFQRIPSWLGRRGKVASGSNYEVTAGGNEEEEPKQQQQNHCEDSNEENGAVQNEVKEVIDAEYKKLGSWSAQEITVGACFALLVALWFFRNPRMFPGWLELFPYKDIKIHDASATVLMVLLVFCLPSQYNFWPFRPWSEPPSASPPLLEWSGSRGVEKRLQWGVILLLGGGFALSDACKQSGLSNLVGEGLSKLLNNLSATTSMFIICLCTATATEFASNTATANILAPILLEAAKKLCINPIYIAFPAILSCSYAFMLPAATAPNAIVKEAAGIPAGIMMSAGLVMNVICVVTTVLVMVTYGRMVFDFGSELPKWLTSEDVAYAECAANANLTTSL